MRTASLALAALLAASCVNTDVTTYRDLPPNPDPASLEVFSETLPDRTFEEIGLIELHGAQASSYGKLIERAREEAAKIGADAILVSRRPVRSAAAFEVDSPVMPGTVVQEGEEPRIWVVPIVWDASTGDRERR